ncbi:hypothetical protein J4Q44_G00394740, partial [Coregonus suidteri]
IQKYLFHSDKIIYKNPILFYRHTTEYLHHYSTGSFSPMRTKYCTHPNNSKITGLLQPELGEQGASSKALG